MLDPCRYISDVVGEASTDARLGASGDLVAIISPQQLRLKKRYEIHSEASSSMVQSISLSCISDNRIIHLIEYGFENLPKSYKMSFSDEL